MRRSVSVGRLDGEFELMRPDFGYRPRNKEHRSWRAAAIGRYYSNITIVRTNCTSQNSTRTPVGRPAQTKLPTPTPVLSLSPLCPCQRIPHPSSLSLSILRRGSPMPAIANPNRHRPFSLEGPRVGPCSQSIVFTCVPQSPPNSNNGGVPYPPPRSRYSIMVERYRSLVGVFYAPLEPFRMLQVFVQGLSAGGCSSCVLFQRRRGRHSSLFDLWRAHPEGPYDLRVLTIGD